MSSSTRRRPTSRLRVEADETTGHGDGRRRRDRWRRCRREGHGPQRACATGSRRSTARCASRADGDGGHGVVAEIPLLVPSDGCRRLGRNERAPTATVAFLLCDIEGSTRLVHETGELIRDDPDRRPAASCGGASPRNGGSVIDAHGDELFAAFETLDAAVAAAVDAQRALIEHTWPDDCDVRVRMGIHVGEPSDDRGGLHGNRRPSRGADRVGRSRRPDPALGDGLLTVGVRRTRPRQPSTRRPARARAHPPAPRGRPSARFPATAEHDRDARERDDRGDRRGLGAAARGRRPASRRGGLRGCRAVRHGRRPAPACCSAQAGRRDRRHQDAPDAHR